MGSGSLFDVLATLTAFSLLLPAAQAPSNLTGTYRPKEGQPVAWQVDSSQTLLWDGVPYLPVGLHIDGNTIDVDRAKSAGINDVIVDLPANGFGWEGVLQALEKANMRYLIQIDSLAPAGKGIAVEPQGYRVPGILQDTTIELTIPGATSALAILATQRDGTVHLTQRVKIDDGKFKLDIKSPNSLEHVLLVFPEMTSIGQPDYWEGFDLQRDMVLTSLKKYATGKGLRGITNPMGQVLRVGNKNNRFVPTSSFFREELKAHLINRYRNLETAMRSWSMSVSDINSWDQVVRLVPLWSGTRGVSLLWDPTTDKTYNCDNKRSGIWNDINYVISGAGLRRFQRLVSSIRQVADVPVVQDWAGWAAPYETQQPALTGVGMTTSGSKPSELAESGARAASSVLRWPKPGWLPATRIDLGDGAEASVEVRNVVEDLSSMGVRAWFVRATNKDVLSAIAAEAAGRATDTALAQWSAKAIYFPESAVNPAAPMRLPGGHWWLPSPASGNRVDLGSYFHAYRYVDGGTKYTAIWTTAGTGRVKLRMADPKIATFVTLDGQDPKPKLLKNGVELTLSEFPTLIQGTDEIPIPEAAFQEAVTKFDELRKQATGVRADISMEDFLFRDTLAAFERNPAGGFAGLRRLYWEVTQKISPYTWIEAESSRATNFSELQQVSGASGGAVLSVDSPGAFDPRGFFAEYNFNVRSTLDQDVWVAARIPDDVLKLVRINVAGQIMQPEGAGISTYSNGLKWYRFGTTRLAGKLAKITFEVFAPGAANLSIDTILLTPMPFNPKGVYPPEIISLGTD